jgi:Zn-dependent metalloprotease
MKSKIIYLLFILFVSIHTTYAQTDTLLNAIAKPSRSEDWIIIKPEVNINPIQFFSVYKTALGLTANDDMRLYKSETDKIGFTHYRFNQFNKGYRIEGAEFLLHAKEGRLISANGTRIKGFLKNSLVSITKEQALQNALRSFPSRSYAWEVPALEQQKKLIQHNVNASFKPIGELVWVSIAPDETIKNPDSYLLCYVFDIYTENMDGRRIFIDAVSGRSLKSVPLVPECTPISVTTNFYSTQGFSTRQIPGSNPAAFNLWNDCQTAFIHTRLWNSTLTNSTDYISGNNNSWGAAASAATSHWCTERSYAYFLNIHGRNGWDNANGGINIYQDALFCADPPTCANITNPNNASFSSGFMRVGNSGNANAIDDWNSLDIIAHEFTHGVTQTSANLVYSKEPGALNESFSDIFGSTCHASLFGVSGNTWLVGFDRKNPNNTTISLYLRNMSNPNDKGDPDTYLGTNWISTTTSTDVGGDNWGVHTNSGVQNYMYYLLVSGGIGTNDNGSAFSLIGIGIVAAREIAYRALTVYLSSSSQFADARNAWVHAAVDLYGECSFQAIETGKAWDAVGLTPPVINQTTPYCGTYGGSIFTVTSPNNYSLAPNCTMTIIPASLVQFGARKVTLNPGFRAQNGSNFRAYVSDCRFAAY